VAEAIGAKVMSKAKSILMNPYLLGMNGFIAGALLLWANPQVTEANPPVPTSTVQLVPPVS